MSTVCKDCRNRYPACADTCQNPEHIKDVERAAKRRKAREKERILCEAVHYGSERMKHRMIGKDGKLRWR